MKRISLQFVFVLLISCSKISEDQIEPVSQLPNEQSVSRKVELLYIVDGVETPVQFVYPELKDVITKTQIVPIRNNKTLLAKYGDKAESGIVYLTTNRN